MYKIVYHNLVLKKDLKSIPKHEQKKIILAIQKKLTKDPLSFGKPLTGELRGYFRLRVDPYRIIYKIRKEEIVVYIVKIGLRKDLIAYIKAVKRLGLF